MSLTRKSFTPGGLRAAAVLAVSLLASAAFSQTYDLVVSIGEVTAWPDEQNVVIPVYLENYSDSIAGFELWLVLDRPDIFEFQTYEDTTVNSTYWKSSGQDYSDSVEIPDHTVRQGIKSYDWVNTDTQEITAVRFDTSGTLISGWQYVRTRSATTTGHDVKIVAVANTYPPPYNPGFGYPNYGDVPLIKLIADVYNLPDTQTERTAVIYIQHDNFDNFGFSDEQGNLIGLIYDTVIDTTCYNCLLWDDPPDDTICLQWEQVAGPTGDSCSVDTSLFPLLDTSIVSANAGNLTVLNFLCGDANGDGSTNILDITGLISYLYREGSEPEPMQAGDADGSGNINILDISCLINYIYREGPEPVCSG